jgi:hypothetical protein
MHKKRAVITISALNYGAQVSVLASSLRKTNPEVPFFYFVLDYDFGENPLKLKKPNANCLALKDLEVFCRSQDPNFSVMNMLFPYDIVEASTAVKPFVLSMMFAKYDFDEIIFLDPDIAVYDSLDSIWEKFEDSNVLLTPHLIKLDRIDLALESERAVLRSGTYNLGFLGLKRSEVTNSFLKWWAARLVKHCTREVHFGLFTDQKWVDILAGAEPTIGILRSPGLNIAHWNIHERHVSKSSSGQYLVNNEPLVFFHFSGFNSLSPDIVTRHFPNVRVEDFGVLKELFNAYCEELLDAGVQYYSALRYGLDYFSNGIKIPEFLRYWAREQSPLERFENVFDVSETNSFFNFLFRSTPGRLCPFAEIVSQIRKDVRDKHLESSGGGNAGFMNWLVQQGAIDLELDKRIVRILMIKRATAEGVYNA